MQVLRLFISSPSDVFNERQIVGRVIERLQGKYWSFVRLEDVFWESSVARATAHFQDELRNPGACDLVVGILWSRLGSPLPERFQNSLGEGYATGTEWELAEAFRAYEASLEACGDPLLAKPDVVVYRRTDERELAKGEDPEQARKQEQALQTYLDREFHHDDAHHTIKRSLTLYSGLESFERRLYSDLETLILRRLPALKPGFDPPPISGCPFKGLSVFDYDDSDRFFGRTRQIREVQDRLRSRAESGTAFTLIYGASGYGKSSLMRAGVAPIVTRSGGALPSMEQWRRVLMQPAAGTGSLCERLARALLAPATEAEHAQAKGHEHYALSGFPEMSDVPISDPGAKGEKWDVASLARYLAAPEEAQAFAVGDFAEALKRGQLHLLLQVDQLEEIFAENVTKEERADFLRAIHALARCGRIWCLATMRSEYFPEVAKELELRALIGGDGGYILPPPDWQSWSEIIRYPALAARLNWERTLTPRLIGEEDSREEWLNAQILEEVKDNPDALPLLEFCLERLYRDTLDPDDPKGLERRRDLLSWDAYVEMKGLRGAIATEADQAYHQLSPSAKGARDYLFGNLVRVDGTVTCRRADLRELQKMPGATAFLETFLGVKLFVTDEEGGRPVVTLAHESLLTYWPVLSEWINEHISDLAAHQRLIRQAKLWEENKRSGKYLLAEGHLAEAERVAASSMFLLDASQREMLGQSQTAARKKLRRFQLAALVFALLAIGAGVLGWVAERRRVETNRQLERSQLEEGRAWLERAKLAWNGKKTPLSALMLAGRAVGFHGFGRDEREESGFSDCLGRRMTDRGSEAERVEELEEVMSFVDEVQPTFLPIWSSPIRQQPFGSVTSVSFSPDGTRLASGSEDNTVKLWDVPSGKEVATLEGHSDVVMNVSFSPDGTRLVSGSSDKTVKLWNVATGEDVATLDGHSGGVTSVSFSPEGTRLVSGSDDGTVKLWDVSTGQEVATLEGHSGGVTCVSFSSDGTRLASGSRDKTVKVWDVSTGQEVAMLEGHSDSVTSVSFSPDGTRLASGSDDGTVKLWDVATWNEIATLEGHWGEVSSVSFSPDGTRLVSGSWPKTVKLWDVTTGKEVATLDGHSDDVTSVAFSPEGTRLVSGSDDGTVKLWDVGKGKEVAMLQGHSSDVWSVSFSPDGTRLASGSWDKTVKLWDVATGKEIATLVGHSRFVMSVSYSPDGTRLASGALDNTVKLWDVNTGKEVATLGGHSGDVTSVAFSSDGTRLASGSDDNTVKLWDVGKGKEVATLEGHSDDVMSVSFSPDRTCLASGSRDGHVKLWDVATGKEVANLEGHWGGVSSVSFNPDGTRLASGSRDGQVKFWDVATGKEVEGELDFPLGGDRMPSSPDGRLVAISHGSLIRLESTNFLGSPDLYSLIEEGIMRFEGREAELIFDHYFLFTDVLVFTSRHYHEDELAALAVPDLAPAETAVLRLRLMGRTGQWRAARAWWATEGAIASLAVRNDYLTLLLVCAGDPIATAFSSALSDLTAEISATLKPESMRDLRVSLALSELLLQATDSDKYAVLVWEAFLSKVIECTSRPWQEGVASRLARVRNIKETPETRRERLAVIIQGFAGRYPDSPDLLRESLATREAADPLRLAEEDRLLALPEAIAKDYTEAAYEAAQRRDATRAKRLLQDAETRFPDDDSLARMAGWSFINLDDRPAALAAFQRALVSLKPEEKPGTDLLTGLSLAQWLNQRTEEAIATYQQLIEAGRAQKTPEDWADPQTIADRDWPEVENAPLEALRAATVAKHQELAPKNSGETPAAGPEAPTPK